MSDEDREAASGGGAAERLRQHLQQRFGPEGDPPYPSDEVDGLDDGYSTDGADASHEVAAASGDGSPASDVEPANEPETEQPR